jgi:hypothetical protein
VFELVEQVKATGIASIQRVERQLQQESQSERPNKRLMEALRDEVEETKHNIPIIAGIVMMLAAVLVTVGGNSISVGCDGGITGAIDGLQMTHRMRNQWADWCFKVQRTVNAEFCGAEDSMATAMQPAWQIGFKCIVVEACKCRVLGSFSSSEAEVV